MYISQYVKYPFLSFPLFLSKPISLCLSRSKGSYPSAYGAKGCDWCRGLAGLRGLALIGLRGVKPLIGPGIKVNVLLGQNTTTLDCV